MARITGRSEQAVEATLAEIFGLEQLTKMCARKGAWGNASVATNHWGVAPGTRHGKS